VRYGQSVIPFSIRGAIEEVETTDAHNVPRSTGTKLNGIGRKELKLERLV
jgi:hypothetical protein